MSYPTSLKTFVLFFILVVFSVGAWEMYWRSEGYVPDMEDDKYLWASNRARVDKMGAGDVILLGSSRVLFDIQLKEWEDALGMKPLMIATAGSTPTPVLEDLVNNSEFNGTIVMGITPPLFFTPPDPSMEMWKHPATYIEQYHKGTFAQKFSQYVSIPLQNSLAFINRADDDMYTNLDLNSRINNIDLPKRVPTHPPFPQFSSADVDRNTSMHDIVSRDTAYANAIKRVWQFYGGFMPPPEVLLELVPVVIGYVNPLIEKFKARGGRIIFLRCPSANEFRENELKYTPRQQFWEVLLDSTGCPGYHFEDYEILNKYDPPESSHLRVEDARTFTTDLCNILKKDGHF